MRQYEHLFYPKERETTTMEHAQTTKFYALPLRELHKLAPDTAWSSPPTISSHLSPIQVCQIIGDWYMACSDEAHRRSRGQFFTPPTIACYMANIAGELHNGMHILDAGAGVGMLAGAICEEALRQKLTTFTLVAYEPDPILYELCLFALHYAHDVLYDHGINLSIELHKHDFVEAIAEQMTQTSLWSKGPQLQHPFDLAILNPPYFKINQKDSRTKLVKDIAEGRTNMYTLFMSLVASSLRVGGHYVSITPRSFASGAYFQHFRREFFNTIAPELIHIFDSRQSAFEDADVLQENIILAGVKKGITLPSTSSITISRSRGLNDLKTPMLQQIPRQVIIDEQGKDFVLHLPTSDIDIHLLQAFKHWDNRLETYGLEISTGPVVPFRNLDTLTSVEKVEQNEAAPLLWLQHVRRMKITWPLETFDKPQGVSLCTGQKLLVRNRTQIILRRFSAKEEMRRITAAVLSEGMFDSEFIGLENHLNYLYSHARNLSYAEAIGVATFLNSSLVDRYFRIASGNTQVSATELRKLPLPSWEHLSKIGKRVVTAHVEQDAGAAEHIIMDELADDLIVGNQEEDIQLPVLRDSRVVMGKIQEAQRILRELGLPPAQQNEISALTLLALCNLDETTSWSKASQQLSTIHNMMGFMKQYYGRTYAENTREVVRRQVIHQFEQARIVDRNPDDSTRPTNSPNTCYALTDEAREVLVQYNTRTWQKAVAYFIEQHGSLWEQYQQSRQAVALPLKLADGAQFYLTPGKHNALQIAIIEKFGPRYAPHAFVLYLGDAANKFVIYEQERLKQLSIPITTHDKLPDVILYREDKNWLYLIEAVTSHGPVSHKRKHEMEKLLQYCTAELVYVTAFLRLTEFRRHSTHIAWETEVWVAEMPEHMIHYNGDRFIGPHRNPTE